MKDLSAGLSNNNYVGATKVKHLFTAQPFECKIKNIEVNGQKRGCSGFITNLVTGKVCYIDTEPFFDYGKGSGLYNNPSKAVMMRTAKDTKDYHGGMNVWLPLGEIVTAALRLTS